MADAEPGPAQAGAAGVLNYARPPQPLARRTLDLFARIVRATPWFIFRRPLRVIEFAIAMVACAIAVYAVAAAVLKEATSAAPGGIFFIGHMLLLVSLGALFQAVAVRRRRPLIFWCFIALPFALLSGMIQVVRCPHATYFQVSGVTVPVAGDPCNNPRKVIPWWLQH